MSTAYFLTFQNLKMKTVAVFALALICVFGVAFAQFGFGGGPAASGGGIGSGGSKFESLQTDYQTYSS